MTISYEEFQSTPATLLADLATKIAAHSQWDELTPAYPSTTTTASSPSGNVTLSVTSAAGFEVGMPIKLTGASTGTVYKRTVTAVNTGANSITMNQSFGTAENTGTTVAADGRLLKTTTDDGAQIVLQIVDFTNQYLMYRMFRTHTGASLLATAYTDPTPWRYIYYNSAAQGTTTKVYGVLSLSSNHIFLSLEGPRANESGAFSTLHGSLRNYMFASSVLRYRNTDATPCVAAWGVSAADSNPQMVDQLWRGEVSRNVGNTLSWTMCRFPTVTMPHFASNAATNFDSYSAVDNKTYVWPYLVVEEGDGLRGRLANFFFIGINRTTYGIDPVDNPGQFITVGNVVYKTLAVAKGDGSNAAGGGFGAYIGTGTDGVYGSAIVAIPYADVP